MCLHRSLGPCASESWCTGDLHVPGCGGPHVIPVTVNTDNNVNTVTSFHSVTTINTATSGNTVTTVTTFTTVIYVQVDHGDLHVPGGGVQPGLPPAGEGAGPWTGPGTAGGNQHGGEEHRGGDEQDLAEAPSILVRIDWG